MRIVFFLILGLLSSPGIIRAEEYETVSLPKGKSISELLYERGERKLYGPRGRVQQTLKLNQLTLKKSRKLAPDYPVKVFIVEKPSEKTEAVPEVVEIVPVEITPTPESSPSEFKFSAGYLSYVGKSDSKGKFSADGGVLGVVGKKEILKAKLPVFIRPSIEVISIPKLENDFFMNFGAGIGTTGVIGSLVWESEFHLQRMFYIYGKDDLPKTTTVTLPGVSATFRKNWDEYYLWAGGGLNFGSSGAKTSPFSRFLCGKKLSAEYSVELNFEYQRREFRTFTQNYITLSAGILKTF